VIYIDSSVALASLLAESRSPPNALWREQLASSRLLEYEVWNRILAKGIGESHHDEARAMLRKITMIELTRRCLQRALRPFPVPVRTLDGFHLATMDYLQDRGESVALASYDNRLLSAADALGIVAAAL
jgi:uncharacterized protein